MRLCAAYLLGLSIVVVAVPFFVFFFFSFGRFAFIIRLNAGPNANQINLFYLEQSLRFSIWFRRFRWHSKCRIARAQNRKRLALSTVLFVVTV